MKMWTLSLLSFLLSDNTNVVLFKTLDDEKRDHYEKLSHLFQEETLWACLAAMSAYGKEFATAEIAYAAIEEVSE